MDVILTLDTKILQGISCLRCGFLDAVMPIVTALGDYGAIWVAVGLLLLFCPKHRRGGLLLLLTLFAGVMIGQGLIKPMVGRIRPFAQAGITELLIPLPMYLWVHYPSDILAGALIGAALSVAAILMDKNLRKRN